MLLLNAYVKQKDAKKLSAYIRQMDSTENLFENLALFDIEAAIDLCRDNQEEGFAKMIAKKSGN